MASPRGFLCGPDARGSRLRRVRVQRPGRNRRGRRSTGRTRQPAVRPGRKRLPARRVPSCVSETAAPRVCASRPGEAASREGSSSPSTVRVDPRRRASYAFREAWNVPGLVLVAPAAVGSTWSALHREEDLDLATVNRALAEAWRRCKIDRGRVAVGGFSDGATHALSIGLQNGAIFRSVLALSRRRAARCRPPRQAPRIHHARNPRRRTSRSAGAVPPCGHSGRPAIASRIGGCAGRPPGAWCDLACSDSLVPRRLAGSWMESLLLDWFEEHGRDLPWRRP